VDRTATALLGLCIGTASLLALPVLFARTAGREDLAVDVPASHPFGIEQAPPAGFVAASLAPSSATMLALPGANRTGLELRTWSASYGPAYQREVTWSILAGPFLEEGQYVCGYSIHAGAELFDTTGAGSGLATSFARNLRLPRVIRLRKFGIPDVPLPPLRSTRLRIRLGSGRVYVSVQVQFTDGTLFSAPRIPVKIASSSNGAPILKRDGQIAAPVFRGPVRDKIVQEAHDRGEDEGGFLGLVFGLVGTTVLGPAALLAAPVGASSGGDRGEAEANAKLPRQAREFATKVVDAALSKATLGMVKLTTAVHPVASRPEDEFQVKLEKDPSVTPSGITLPLCVRIVTGAPRTNDLVPGPVDLHQPAAMAGSESGAALTLALNADALDQVMYYLWQSGVLRRLGQGPTVFAALEKDVRTAAFDFTGFSPGLPPTVDLEAKRMEGLPFALGDVELGTIGPKVVAAHGLVGLRIDQAGGAIALHATIPDIHVDCAEAVGPRERLTPCLADLLPVARDALARKPLVKSWSSAGLLAELLKLSFEGTKLNLTGLKALTVSNPPQLELSATASFK